MVHLTWGDRLPDNFFDGSRARIIELLQAHG